MAQWRMSEVNRHFSKLVNAANGNGPQLVLFHKQPVAVVLSPDDYRRLARQADDNFSKLLAHDPFDPADLEPVGMSLSDGG